MRELTVAEIEVVSGGWFDVFGAMSEQIAKVVQFLSGVFPSGPPNLTSSQIDTAREICTSGIAGMETSRVGASVSASISGFNGFTFSFTQAGGEFKFTCNPPSGGAKR